MKHVVIIILIVGIVTGVVLLGVAGYLYQKLQKRNSLRQIQPIIKETTPQLSSQETMIYSKEKLDSMQKQDIEDHKETSGGFPKKTTNDSFSKSQNNSVSFVPKPAQLDGPEEISQTQVLPKNHSSSDNKIQGRSPKNIPSLENLAPPEEISGLGFSPSGLSANFTHRSRGLLEEESEEDSSNIDPEDATNIIPK
jgi:hypothetical protein